MEEVLGVRELVRTLGYEVEGPSRTFCNSKGVVTAACGVNMIIKKHSTALAFHRTCEAIATGTVELQHISGDSNWSDFLTKAAENFKFIYCAKGLMVPCVNATIL